MLIDMDYIRRQLAVRRKGRQLAIVSHETGISMRTIFYVMKGRDMQVGKAKQLQEYLTANSRKKRLDDTRPAK